MMSPSCRLTVDFEMSPGRCSKCMSAVCFSWVTLRVLRVIIKGDVTDYVWKVICIQYRVTHLLRFLYASFRLFQSPVHSSHLHDCQISLEQKCLRQGRISGFMILNLVARKVYKQYQMLYYQYFHQCKPSASSGQVGLTCRPSKNQFAFQWAREQPYITVYVSTFPAKLLSSTTTQWRTSGLGRLDATRAVFLMEVTKFYLVLSVMIILLPVPDLSSSWCWCHS